MCRPWQEIPPAPVLPLRRDVAASLREWLAAKPAGQSVWPGTWASNRHGAEMLRMDLTAADIDDRDERGRVLDFYALRHTFISNLARAGVHPRNAQALARYSTIDLTMDVYTHVEMADLAGEVENLPAVLGGGDEAGRPAEVPTATAHAPAELAGLISAWKDLPDNVRSAIAAMANT